MTPAQALDQGAKPLHDVSGALRARKGHPAVSSRSRTRPRRTRPADLDLKVLIPAYILSELKTGFQIGAVLFLPFLVIDLVVASVTLSIGMMQLPPVMISAPFKILLFVLVDGWNLVVGSLMKSFYSMTPDTVVQIIRQTLMTTFWLAAPLLADRVHGGHRRSAWCRSPRPCRTTPSAPFRACWRFWRACCCCCPGCCRGPCRTPPRCSEI